MRTMDRLSWTSIGPRCSLDPSASKHCMYIPCSHPDVLVQRGVSHCHARCTNDPTGMWFTDVCPVRGINAVLRQSLLVRRLGKCKP